jgi:hypothetical protein
MRGCAALAGLTLAVALLAAPAARADDACTVDGQAVPLCQTVSSPSISIGGWGSKSWSLYCPRQASYYWGGWSADRHGCDAISVVENPFAENESQADFNMTNWCAHTHSVTLTIGCSPINQAGGCSGGSGFCPSDPGCPQHDNVLRCVGRGQSKQCWNEWQETCISGTTVTNYYCTEAAFAPCCFSC